MVASRNALGFVFLLSVMLFYASYTLAQKPQISLKEIMRGYDFIGHPPTDVYWSLSGDSLYYSVYDTIHKHSNRYAYHLKKGEVIALDETTIPDRIFASADQIKSSFYSDEKFLFYEGKMMLLDSETNFPKSLVSVNQSIGFAGFGNNGKTVYLKIGLDFYAYNLQSGSLYPLNEMIKGKVPSKDPSGSTYLEQEEHQLFQFLSERKKQKSMRDSINLVRKGLFHKPKYYLDKKNANPLTISSNGRYVFYSVSLINESKQTLVTDYITSSGYTTSNNARAKVGEDPTLSELLIGDLQKDSFYTMDFSDLPGIKRKPDYLCEYAKDRSKYSPLYDQPKPIHIYKVISSEEYDKLIIELHSHDNKDRWLLAYDPDSRKYEVIDHQHDEAWIGGPGVKYGNRNTGFIPGTSLFYFKSEKTGYAHIYLYDIITKKTRALTSGTFEVHDIFWSNSRNAFLVRANREDSGTYFIYLLDLGGYMVNLYCQEGNYEMIVDLEGDRIASLHSTVNKPPHLYLLNEGEAPHWYQITNTTFSQYSDITWAIPEFIQFRASDGANVPARLYRPDASKSNGAAVLFVHGAGYLQNAHKYWSIYYREYMFHNLLVNMGYTVFDIDYRASAGYGRDWRTSIYRHMGGRDLEDHIDGVNFLIDSVGVDPDRIGIYGGSYGGFITMMALFKYPGVFKCGAALRSVTDWAHYNHGYTSNILNTPKTDSIAYKRSSPIYFAEHLQDYLLILHGVLDNNVQFQDVVRLNQRLIELEKTTYDMAIYPIENHGFTESSSWYDEYRRILNMFEKYLR
jgi:dipeptidyl aminopeptidase/acylaminoacyl peptidase